MEEAQIALAGRSNVWQQIILCQRPLQAEKTCKNQRNSWQNQVDKFYKVLPCDYYLVDLPGYGYARASHEEQKNWSNVLEYYLIAAKN